MNRRDEILKRMQKDARDYLNITLEELLKSMMGGTNLESLLGFLAGAFKGTAAPQGFQVPLENAYRILGLGPGASDEEIKERYRELAKKLHPDAGGTDALFGILQMAYEQIKKERGFS